MDIHSRNVFRYDFMMHLLHLFAWTNTFLTSLTDEHLQSEVTTSWNNIVLLLSYQIITYLKGRILYMCGGRDSLVRGNLVWERGNLFWGKENIVWGMGNIVLGKGNLVCSFPRRDNNEVVLIHWQKKKVLSRNTSTVLTKLGTWHLWVRGILFFFQK